MESNWKVGDVAICIKVGRIEGYAHDNTSDYPNLRLNAEYIVNAVRICECGGVTLDVGLNSNSNKGTTCICGALSRPGTGIHWCAAQRFAKKRTREEIKEEIAEAVQNEDFLTATELRNELYNLNK